MTVSNVTGDSISSGIDPIEDHSADPNAHHDKNHPLYGGTHSDVDTAAPLADRHVLNWNGTKFVPDYRAEYFAAYVNGDEYHPQQIVHDNGWIMVANTVTTDRAAPQDVGAPEYSTDLTTVLDEGLQAAIVTVEHTYTLTKAGYLQEILVQTPFWDSDSVTKVELEIGSTIAARENLILSADTWVSVAQGQGVLAVGTVVTIRFSQYQAAAATVISGGWTSVIGTGVPASQTFRLETVLLPGTITIDHTDLDSASRETELRGVAVGSTITLAETADSSRSTTIRTTSVDTTNTLAYSTFTYDVIATGATGPVRTNRTTSVRIDIPITVTTRFAKKAWEFSTAPSFASVTTAVYHDGVDQAAATTTGYGVNVKFQEAFKSPDWDVMVVGGGGSSATNSTAVATLQNRSVGWRDNLAAIVGESKGVGAPTMSPFGITGNCHQMKMAIGDSVYVNWHINHDVKPGSISYFHAHWSTDGTQTNAVTWRFKVIYCAGHNQANYPAESNVDLTEAAHGTIWRAMITEDSVGFTSPEIDSLVIVEIERITNVTGTDNTDDVFLNYADIHYQVDRYATPNRSPNFYI